MKHHFKVAALVVVLLAATSVFAQAQQSVYRPVIELYQQIYGYPTGRFQMHEDGSGVQMLAVSGWDLTHNSVNGWRWFLEPVFGPTRLDFFAVREDGDPATRVLLTTNPRFFPGALRWSHNAKRVAYHGTVVGDTETHDCLVVAEVVWDAGAPVALSNERCALELDTRHPGESAGDPQWAWDDVRLTYGTGASINYVPHGRIWIATVPVPVEGQPVPPATEVEVVFTDGVPFSGSPAFSPVPFDDRLVFIRYRGQSSMQRYDLWVVTIPDFYSGWAVTPKAITNSRNTQTTYRLIRFDWSPDGQWIAFTATPTNFLPPDVTYKIRSDGSGKSVVLTNAKGKGPAYGLMFWRP